MSLFNECDVRDVKGRGYSYRADLTEPEAEAQLMLDCMAVEYDDDSYCICDKCKTVALTTIQGRDIAPITIIHRDGSRTIWSY